MAAASEAFTKYSNGAYVCVGCTHSVGLGGTDVCSYDVLSTSLYCDMFE